MYRSSQHTDSAFRVTGCFVLLVCISLLGSNTQTRFLPRHSGPFTQAPLPAPLKKASGKFDSKGSTNSSSQVRKALTPHYTYLLGSSQLCIPLIFNPTWSSPPAEWGRGKNVQLSLVPLHAIKNAEAARSQTSSSSLSSLF